MKAESINKIVFEELKGTNIIIDIKHNLIDRLKERERKLQSQLKERETIIDMQKETIKRAVDILSMFEAELKTQKKEDEKISKTI